MSAVAQPQDWKPLAIDDRKRWFVIFNEALGAVMLAGGIVFYGPEFAQRIGGSWVLILLTLAVLAAATRMVLRRILRLWPATRLKFFEEGLSIRTRDGAEFLRWGSVTAAHLLSMSDRYNLLWRGTLQLLTLTFNGNRSVSIPLTAFSKERSLGEAIVNRIPVAVERPMIPLKDH